jgi:hypothetical protein
MVGEARMLSHEESKFASDGILNEIWLSHDIRNLSSHRQFDLREKKME